MTVKAIRPAVLAFAATMEVALRAHDHDRGEAGWENDSLEDLLDRVLDEFVELRGAIKWGRDSYNSEGAWLNHVRLEAADVANFCMMISDVALHAIEADKS